MQDDPGIVSVPTLDVPGYLTHGSQFFADNFHYFSSFLKFIIGLAIGLSIPLSLVFIIGIIIAVERLKRIRRAEDEILYPHTEMAYEEPAKGDIAMAHRWDKILSQIESPNEGDWRSAIIEADIMLGELLTKMGYRGETMGEQFKRVAAGDFKTLKKAQEAHGVRNKIAHDGASYPLTQDETRHVIYQYRDVFEEFYYI
ncbi:MAG: hypothetical protein V4697_00520 [Patescibacteria group bacterium]